MKEQTKPNHGGVIAVLQVIAILEVFGALFGGAVANLSLSAEVIFMTGAVIFAALLFAGAAVVQELRNIAFNTRPHAAVAAGPAVTVSPAPGMSDTDAMRHYGITRDGDYFLFGGFRYDKLSNAIAYAQRQSAAT
jgi:hypothetical protein